MRRRDLASVVLPADVPGATKSQRVRAMFSRIAARYDLMNRIMTLGLDGGWRREAARLAEPAGAMALDVGTGTGDLAIALARASARAVVGVDFVEEMLGAARRKSAGSDVGARVRFVNADALQLPFADATFDCVVNGFVLRNVGDLRGGLEEMARVLKPGGRLVCLELTHPPRSIAPFFELYFGRLVPFVGGIITGQPAAYKYLPASLAPLPDAVQLARLLGDIGFRQVDYQLVGGGTVAIHVARARG